jgi:DNA topoisomerase-1
MAAKSRDKKDTDNVAVQDPPDKPAAKASGRKSKKAPVTSGPTGESPGKSRGSRAGGKRPSGADLVIVESPAKARTIERILGNKFVVKASQGHVRDLPKGKLGVNVEEGFEPSYSVLKDKQPVVQEIKKLGETAPSIYLATDPDREGEAISWHLVNAAAWDKGDAQLRRVVFHEITPEAVKEAFDHPRDIDMELVNAQQARRILDRLVGYQISPLLWRRVQRGLSAGRVQSVALKMVVEREREVEAFVPREYWTIDAQLQKQAGTKKDRGKPFTATLHSLKGTRGKLDIPDEPSAKGIEGELAGAEYKVSQVKKREVKQSPSPPFITSTLQQEAGRKLRFTAKRTMMAAQQLYEGLSIGSEGSVGLITYMRTDSTNVAASALQETREYILEKFSKEHLPAKARVFRKKSKGAQEAHEAIRPTSIRREPQSLKAHLTPDQFKIYDLVWRRMLASQMAEARSDATTIDTEAACNIVPKVYIFRATGSVLKFPGFRTIYMESKDDGDDEDGKGPLPELSEGEILSCLGLDPKQHFTQPPPRYTEASLIKALEENGIGRPSTYAPTISTIMDRHYVQKDAGKLKPTVLGCTVCDLLTEFFTDIMNTGFTAKMEEELDEVARGEREWVPMLEGFYGPFHNSLEVATEAMPRVKVEEQTDEVCEKCESPMVIKMGRFGRFMACSNFPECKNTRPVDGGPAEDAAINEDCEKCGSPMVAKSGRFGRFLACSNYPECKSTKAIVNKIGVQCPKCGGDLIERKRKGRGNVFYGCSKYPDCDFIANQRPLPEPCPECGGLMVSAGQDGGRCTACAWKGDVPERQAVAAEA